MVDLKKILRLIYILNEKQAGFLSASLYRCSYSVRLPRAARTRIFFQSRRSLLLPTCTIIIRQRCLGVNGKICCFLSKKTA